MDPATLKRKDSIGDPTSRIGCTATGENIALNLFALNKNYDEALADDRNLRKGEPARLINVNGRDAFVGPNRVDVNGCTVDMRTNFGYVFVDGGFLISQQKAGERGLRMCDEVIRAATLIEPSLPKGS